MKKVKVAICGDSNFLNHSTNWGKEWISYCVDNQIEFEIVDCYDSNIINKLNGFDILLWHFSGYVYVDMLIARSILYSAKNMGLKVFPDFNDSWHFDDKIAETYLLQSVNAPIPESNMFYSYDAAACWFENTAKYPVVAKLRNGSGSHNVKLLNSQKEALNYCSNIFGKGISSSPSLIFKSSSNFNSAKSLKVFLSRIKRIPEFLRTVRNSKQFSKERGYVFVQEFIPNDGYDLKVVVVGNKLSYIARNVRKGDFRASGGGNLFVDNSIVTKEIINYAFTTNIRLGFKCMGYDFVVNNRNNQAKIVEISYGFSHAAQLICGGHFDQTGLWHDLPLNAPKELLSDLIDDINNE
jgi:glutathione synthase/RimK-type ligase-like ATP-grasp enzyme